MKVHETRRLKLTISNAGLGVLHGEIDTSQLRKPFSATDAGKFSLPDGGRRVLTVTFAPKAGGSFSGAIAITSDDTALNGPVSISVSGTAQ